MGGGGTEDRGERPELTPQDPTTAPFSPHDGWLSLRFSGKQQCDLTIEPVAHRLRSLGARADGWIARPKITFLLFDELDCGGDVPHHLGLRRASSLGHL